MNIFILDEDPAVAAKYLCDKHVPKMFLESVQILCTVLHLQGKPALYKPTHKKHPCVLWALEPPNTGWLTEHAKYLHYQYETRFRRTHKSARVLAAALADLQVEYSSPLSFVQCMPDQYKDPDPVVAYRRYYLADKLRFAKWERGIPAPYWV